MKPIRMVDLTSQYLDLKSEIDTAVINVFEKSNFIQGEEVKIFSENLAKYLSCKHVITCANGTDALQIALMTFNFPEGSEIITPGFSYIAVAEVCHLLNLKPIFVDVDEHTFNIDIHEIEKKINSNTKAIVPVHLFGQCADMEPIMAIAEKHNLKVIEDNAQSIGAEYTFSNGKTLKAGTIGNIGTTSFFPSKNLGCYGDGGAVFTNDDELANKIKMIANHGQSVKYIHDVIGVNSRLDTVQAAILNTKLKHLNSYNSQRQEVANKYNEAFKNHQFLQTPFLNSNTTHVYHQYTLKMPKEMINDFKKYLDSHGIPTMIYYPKPLHHQLAYHQEISLPVSEYLSQNVVSLPIGTNMETDQINYIIQHTLEFFNK